MEATDLYTRLYRSLYRIRRVEEEIARVYPTDKIKSPVHLSIGQEAVSVGVCEALLPEDVVFGTYRGHALYLAKGGDLNKMMAELYGKATGCANGKGGSMHLIDRQVGMMGTSAIVATTVPQAVGYAYAMRLRKVGSIVASFLGDGAAEEGVFHESMNFAALKKLPIIFICENNGYAIHSRQENRQANQDICSKARAHGVPATRIDGNDVLEIWKNTWTAAKEIRSGLSGPRFLECRTYRWREHVGPQEDFDAGYRSREEAQVWMNDDQVLRMRNLVGQEISRWIEKEVAEEIQNALDFAEKSPFPQQEQLYTDVLAGA